MVGAPSAAAPSLRPMFGINGWEALLLAVPLAVVAFVVGGIVVLLRRSADTGRRVTPTSRPCVPTSARRCATWRSCATTPSATWAAG